MKRITKILFSLVLLLFSIVGLSACELDGNALQEDKNSQASMNFRPNSFNIGDLAVIDKDTKKVINIGMSKEKVEEYLGKQDIKNFLNLYNYNGLEVFYRGNKVAGMVIKASNNYTSRFVTYRDIGLGNTKEEMISKYGKGKEDKGASNSINYIIEMNNNKLEQIDGSPQELSSKADKIYVISISFFKNGNEKLSMVLIGDYKFAYEMK